jgi:hypothetical protein
VAIGGTGYAVRSAEKTICVQKLWETRGPRAASTSKPRGITAVDLPLLQRRSAQKGNEHKIMRQPSGTRARNLARTVLERLESLARSGDETAIELIEQRRAAEKTPTKLVKPPAYRQRKSIG